MAPYLQIAGGLRSRILFGDLAPGEQLPSQHELAGQYEVARATVQAALRVLREEGLIVSRKGAGNFVAVRPSGAPAVYVTPLIRVHRYEPILAIKWPQFDRWLMVWPNEFAGEGKPAAATEWRPVLRDADVSGEDWVDPSAAHYADVTPYTKRMRGRLAEAHRALQGVGDWVDELERHPWNV